MNATPETAEATQEDQPCWCCSRSFAEEELVHLGSHPEVGLCRRCAQWVYRRSAEEEAARRRGLAARYRGAFGRSRDWVVRHELQNRPVIGRLIRGLDHWLP